MLFRSHRFFILPDADQKAHFLYMTRNCCSPDGFLVESEPDTDDAGSYMGYIDTEVEDMPVDGDETEEEADSDGNYLDSDDTGIDYGVWTVEYGEVVGDVDEDEMDVVDMEEDDATAGMIPAEEETEEDEDEYEVARPIMRVRNVVDSDDDGETAARPVHPPGTMAVFDELAPGDIVNPCEFQIKANTVM